MQHTGFIFLMTKTKFFFLQSSNSSSSYLHHPPQKKPRKTEARNKKQNKKNTDLSRHLHPKARPFHDMIFTSPLLIHHSTTQTIFWRPAEYTQRTRHTLWPYFHCLFSDHNLVGFTVSIDMLVNVPKNDPYMSHL